MAAQRLTTKRRRLRISDASRKASVLANLFPAAHDAVEPWAQFPWHSATGERWDAHKAHSSQALAIDVFGTLKLSDSRHQVLDRLAADMGLTAGGPWEVELEWCDKSNPLREKHLTQVDAVARSPHNLIFFECKFTESDGGQCSQTQRLKTGPRKGLRQCDGSYMWQTNPANGNEARCALTAKGIRYWDVIPRVFDYDADASYIECPFAGPWFQWMRNLTLCHEAARARSLRPAFVVVYADGAGLAMSARVRSAGWQRLEGRLQPSAITFRAMSYQAVLRLAVESAPDDATWPNLADWVRRKIDQRVSPVMLAAQADFPLLSTGTS